MTIDTAERTTTQPTNDGHSDASPERRRGAVWGPGWLACIAISAVAALALFIASCGTGASAVPDEGDEVDNAHGMDGATESGDVDNAGDADASPARWEELQWCGDERPDDLVLPSFYPNHDKWSCAPVEEPSGYATFEQWMSGIDVFLAGTVVEVREVEEVVLEPRPFTEVPAGQCENPSEHRPVEIVLEDVNAAFGHDGSTAVIRLPVMRSRQFHEALRPGLRIGGGFFGPLDGHEWYMVRIHAYQPLFEVHEDAVWFQDIPDITEVLRYSMGLCQLWVPGSNDLQGVCEDALMGMARATRDQVGEQREGNRLWEVATNEGRHDSTFFRWCERPPPPPPPTMADVDCRGVDESCIEDPFADGCPGHPGYMYCHCYEEGDCDPIFGSSVRCEDERCVTD